MDKEIMNAMAATQLHFDWIIAWASGGAVDNGNVKLLTTGMSVFCDKIEEYKKKYVLFMNDKETLTLKKKNHSIEEDNYGYIKWIKK